MNSERKVKVRYYSGGMRVVAHSILPSSFTFQCKSIESSAIKATRILCNLDRCILTYVPAAKLGKYHAARCQATLVKSKSCIRAIHVKNIDAKPIVSEIQDFRKSDIEKAKRWWYRNKDRLVALLPLTWQEITYTTQFPEKFEKWLYSDTLNPAMREIYVFERLRRIQQALNNFTRL